MGGGAGGALGGAAAAGSLTRKALWQYAHTWRSPSGGTTESTGCCFRQLGQVTMTEDTMNSRKDIGFSASPL
jgi:hypothetical protein